MKKLQISKRDPIVGHRGWYIWDSRLMLADDNTWGCRGGPVWPTEDKLASQCHKRYHGKPHRPHGACTCGIYAFKYYHRFTHVYINSFHVYGQIALWGGVMYEKSQQIYRAQFARPLAFYYDVGLANQSDILDLAIAYGVPVIKAPTKERTKCCKPKF